MNTRTNAELEGVFAARRHQHAAEAARRREELGRATAPLIAQTLPPHTGWMTLDDVCVLAGIEREEADAGCDVLAASASCGGRPSTSSQFSGRCRSCVGRMQGRWTALPSVRGLKL